MPSPDPASPPSADPLGPRTPPDHGADPDRAVTPPGEAPGPTRAGEAPGPTHVGEAPGPTHVGEAPGPTHVGEAPGLDALHAIAEAARSALPPPFAALAAEVRLEVDDWPDDATLDELDIEDAYGLTGLYDGVPLIERSASDPPTDPGTVWLFRRPILDEWAERGDVALEALVAHVVVHELAHHFGWSDEDIAAIDRWWE